VRSLSLLALFACPAVAAAAPDAPPPELTDYVSKKDESFAWKLADTRKSDSGTVYEIDLISQTWQGIAWDHKLLVFVHKGAKPQKTMVLYNTGGKPDLTNTAIGLAIAEKVGAPVAFLFGVPKQPLYVDPKTDKLTTTPSDAAKPREGALSEDALIAETFVRFLATKDGSWPLLFPMVKSVVKGMDCLQAFAKKEWGGFEVQSFVITGASKRGWTSWLTAATGDKRVKAIAPIVIDTLNMPAQMKNQVQAFGKPSEMIRDYTARKLIPIPETTEAEKLWQMIDPWVYREKLTLPKMIINGANDPYWPLDALNSYWDDLKGDKWILYVPNAGHDLREANAKGEKELLPTRAVNTLSAFSRCMIFDKPMPKLSWEYTPARDGVSAEVSYEGRVTGQRAWQVTSDSRDFRKAVWSEKTLLKAGGVVMGVGVSTTVEFPLPGKGFAAGFVETEFEMDGLKFNLSSQLRILEPAKK
jgi:PhoPQ-activated pathogenicity-related protein